MLRDEGAVLDVARAVRRALEFAGDLPPRELEADALRFAAVQHQLLVAGEAVKRLTDEFRAAHPGLPWAELAAMRDRIIHRYDEVDASIVWETVHEDLPELLDQLEALLPGES